MNTPLAEVARASTWMTPSVVNTQLKFGPTGGCASYDHVSYVAERLQALGRT